MGRYYFLIRYLPEHADLELLAGRCISIMHGFTTKIQTSAYQVGVVFPKWSNNSLGNIIGFVAEDEKALIGLSYQPYFSTMKSEQLFDISPIEPVPTALDEVRFVRNTAIEKTFLGSKKRRINRTLKRAEYSGKTHTLRNREEREFDLYHSIPISSISSGEDFLLNIQKEQVCNKEAPNFNGYGFATNQARRGTVPNLSLTLF